MIVERQKLLDILEAVKPALSSSDFIPILKHIWFTGKHVMAYNDQIAISIPLPGEFIGALPGSMLTDLIRMSDADKVKLEAEADGNAKIIMKRRQIKLAIMPAENFAFEMPAMPRQGNLLDDDGHFLAGIQSCMRSLGSQIQSQDELGITVMPGKEGTLFLFATNRSTMSSARVKAKTLLREGIILPRPFCEQMLALKANAEQLRLCIMDDHALFQADDRMLFGRILPLGQFDFHRMMSQMLPRGFAGQMVAIPEQLPPAIEVAILIATNSQGQEVGTTFTCQGKQLRLHTQSHRGEISDVIPIEEHPDMTNKFKPTLVKAGFPGMDKMLATERCLITGNGRHLYILARTGG